MKKGKILAAVLSCTMLLSAAFAMQSSAATMDMVKDGNFPAGTTAWTCVADEDKKADKPFKFEDGKVVLTKDDQDWLHLKQTVKVKSNTKYRFSITYTLTEGTLRLDVVKPGAEKADELVCSNDITTKITYNSEQTYETDIRMAEGQTEFVLDIRNSGPFGKAVGEITSISFVELDALGKPVEGTPEYPEQPSGDNSGDNSENEGDSPKTGVVFPVAALCAALTSAGALAVTKRK